MKKLFSALLVIFSSIIYVNGQSADIALKEYYIDAEFFLAQEFFVDALHDYLEVYKRGYKDNANINYKIGMCYLSIPGQKDRAIEFFEKAKASASEKYKGASLTEVNAPLDVYLYLGNAYRVNNILDKAIESFKKYKTLIPANEVQLQKYADSQIEACNIANEFMSNPKDIVFENMGKPINSSNDDYKAVLSGDGNTIFFMHKLPFYDAVSVSRKVDGNWTRAENITPQILSDGNQFVSSVSYDGKTLILTKEDEFNSDLYFSKFVDNRWTPSEPIKGGNINTKYWESHASLSKDGNLLYFTSNRKGGIGEMDIYVSKKVGEIWSEAKNIGKTINTELSEDAPFITEDGKTLYFSSQGFANMGGYDIFYSKLENDTSWSVPENIGYPISTTDDDIFYFPLDNGKVAYTSRIRSDGFGGMDIYMISEKTAPVESFAETLIAPVEEKQLEVEAKDTISEKIEPQAVIEEIAEEVPQETLPDETKPTVAEVKTFEITPLLFDFDKSNLTQEGKMKLDKIILLMNENENLKIVFTGFTDALGPEEYNLRLSEKRAMQSLTYFVNKGIDAKRLKAIGKGETEFIAPNSKTDGSDFPEGRKYNRRVEFEVSGIDSNTLLIKRIDPVPDIVRSQNK